MSRIMVTIVAAPQFREVASDCKLRSVIYRGDIEFKTLCKIPKGAGQSESATHDLPPMLEASL